MYNRYVYKLLHNDKWGKYLGVQLALHTQADDI
jgi:hypothetical protein